MKDRQWKISCSTQKVITLKIMADSGRSTHFRFHSFKIEAKSTTYVFKQNRNKAGGYYAVKLIPFSKLSFVSF